MSAETDKVEIGDAQPALAFLVTSGVTLARPINSQYAFTNGEAYQ